MRGLCGTGGVTRRRKRGAGSVVRIVRHELYGAGSVVRGARCGLCGTGSVVRGARRRSAVQEAWRDAGSRTCQRRVRHVSAGPSSFRGRLEAELGCVSTPPRAAGSATSEARSIYRWFLKSLVKTTTDNRTVLQISTTDKRGDNFEPSRNTDKSPFYGERRSKTTDKQPPMSQHPAPVAQYVPNHGLDRTRREVVRVSGRPWTRMPGWMSRITDLGAP